MVKYTDGMFLRESIRKFSRYNKRQKEAENCSRGWFDMEVSEGRLQGRSHRGQETLEKVLRASGRNANAEELLQGIHRFSIG